MPGRSRFRAEALDHHRATDGLGPVLGDLPRPTGPPGPAGRRPLWRPRSRARRVPVHLQAQVSDCGAAALVSVLNYHGIAAALDDVRARTDAGRNGASARTLLDVARDFGLSGRGVRADLDALEQLPAGTILFWNFNHFVVLERAGEQYIDIVDPAHGRRRLSRSTVSESFTGVALEFDPPLTPAGRSPRATGSAPTPWHRLWSLLPHGRELALLLGVSAALTAFELALPFAAGLLVERVVGPRSPGVLPLTASLLAVLVVLYFALYLTRSFLVSKRQAVIEKRLTLGIVRHLAALPYDFFTVRSSGDLALRARSSYQLVQVLSLTAISAALDGVLIVAYLVAIAVTNLMFSLLIVVLAALQGGLLVLTWRRQAALSQEVLDRQTKAQQELVEMLESMATLKAGGMSGRAAERWSHSLVHEVNKRWQARRNLSLFVALNRTLQFAAPVLVLLLGIGSVLRGHGSLGTAISFMTLTIAVFIPLAGLFDAGAGLAAVRPTVARMDDVLSSAPEPAGLFSGAGVAEPGRIRVRAAGYRYPGAPRPTLSDVDLHVQPGQFVVLVGRSGSGKSTLGMLLAGLHLPTSGSITVDGVDLAALDRPTYRRRIGYVNQDAQLFGGSLYENVVFGADEVTAEIFTRAVQLAQVDDDVVAMPMGYDTLVAPDGHGLSGGQRQRIVLARALAKQPKLLILDEATSALDPELEKAVLRGLIDAGITLIVIAHRLTVADQADQVVVLRDGRVVETGTPHELMSTGEEYLCLR
ncbi:peptidase domain-containing ABC transporter [Actinoplanes sp. N902-109]|uniref:peptidase domain-containing ABC transporter n=1 Tax=Actinoplanes sp. (strain N902-109) TaxID=649831 RepID=UPI0003296486|nr:peptidase domain-containing ABC transporter [Actinoplanes sp. N902-109]AGL19156.1 ABC transporter [Actinoplanes sp. N902-109]